MVSLSLFIRKEAATKTCSLKCEAVHEFGILAKLLKSTYEDFADLQTAALLKNELF